MRNLREYCRPQTIEEALRLLSRKGLRNAVLTCGAEESEDVESVVDPTDLPFAYIRRDNSGLRLGGLTKLQEIVDSTAAASFAAGTLVDATLLTATSLLRNQSTLAGSLLAQRVSPELAAPLLVLEAEVLIQRLEGSTTLSLADLYQDVAAGIEGALLTEVFVPAPPPGAQIHLRRVSRTPSERAVIAVAALSVTVDGTIRELRLAAAGVGLRPKRLREMESRLTGRKRVSADISPTLSRAIPRIELLQDCISGSDYRGSMLQVLIGRAILGN